MQRNAYRATNTRPADFNGKNSGGRVHFSSIFAPLLFIPHNLNSSGFGHVDPMQLYVLYFNFVFLT